MLVCFLLKILLLKKRGKNRNVFFSVLKKVKNDVIGFTIKPLTNDVRGL